MNELMGDKKNTGRLKKREIVLNELGGCCFVLFSLDQISERLRCGILFVAELEQA